MNTNRHGILNDIIHTRGASHMLKKILAIRASVGEGLSDNDLSCLLRESTLLNEAGFGFLSFFDGMVTFTVPEQDLATWYPKEAWSAPEKEQVARALAKKHMLFLYEPPDHLSPPCRPEYHDRVKHHFELANPQETVVVAHTPTSLSNSENLLESYA